MVPDETSGFQLLHSVYKLVAYFVGLLVGAWQVAYEKKTLNQANQAKLQDVKQ